MVRGRNEKVTMPPGNIIENFGKIINRKWLHRTVQNNSWKLICLSKKDRHKCQ